MTGTVIGVLIVEDDFRVAQLHADLVGGVRGMRVVGVAHTASEALEQSDQLRPDLVLLDEYLPDQRGSTIIGGLHAAVIVISAEAGPDAVRRAIAAGALNVVLKPFPPRLLTQRLEAFVRFWTSFDTTGPLDQRTVDRAFTTLREGDSPAGAMPKGRSAVTADAVRDTLTSATDPLTAQQVADLTGVSRATAQRYLADLVAAGRVDLGLRYGSTGRPEHEYTWRGRADLPPPRRRT